MYKNRWRRRWEASEPVHLIGWKINYSTDEMDNHDFIKMTLESTSTGEQRECWVLAEIIPSEVVQRNWKKGGR